MKITHLFFDKFTSQLNATHGILDFMRKYFITFVVYISFSRKLLGNFHLVYIVQICLSKPTDHIIQFNEPYRKILLIYYFLGRTLKALVILQFVVTVTSQVLFDAI